MSAMKDTITDHYDQAFTLGYEQGYAAALEKADTALRSLAISDTPQGT